MNNTWLILDTDYLCHRARWSMKDLSWKGAATGVVYGVLQSVLQLQERFQTDKVAFCFDSHVSKRREIYPDYKANRKNRQPMTEEEEAFEKEYRRQVVKLRKEYLPEIGFRNVFWQSGYESDDLMAVAALEAESFPTWSGVIVTADHDLYQCIRGNVSVYNPQKRENMTLQRFYQTYHIEPKHWATIKSIAGCSSDNIPGAKGIGEKTALKFIQDQLKKDSKAYQTIRRYCLSPEEKIAVRLVTLPLEGTGTVRLKSDKIKPEGWDSVCRKLGFKSLRHRLPRIGK
ncbi:MAG: hypothetical protein FJY85_23255 [Deltaproteobacteria bacterium]|nr:hypothetical protein [Deltaproteobacteria bacterium]